MPKGQISRVPWPGNSWMPFAFHAVLQVQELGFLESTMQPYQRHLKGLLATYPSCLFQATTMGKWKQISSMFMHVSTWNLPPVTNSISASSAFSIFPLLHWSPSHFSASLRILHFSLMCAEAYSPVWNNHNQSCWSYECQWHC